MNKLHYFADSISLLSLPEKFTYPFHYTPHPLCVAAAGEFGRIAEICRSLLAPKARQQRLWIGQPPYLYDAETPRIRLGTPHSAY